MVSISFIISILFGITFLSFAIYQIKTGRAVSKAEDPHEDPRECGFLFLILAFMAFGLTFVMLPQSFKFSDFANTALMFISIIFAFVACLIIFMSGFLGLRNHRIYTIKHDSKFIKHNIKLQKLVIKFYKFVGISEILLAVSGLCAFILPQLGLVPLKYIGIVCVTPMIWGMCISFVMVIISIAAKKKK